MNLPAIKVESVGKLYRLDRVNIGAKSFRDLLTNLASAPVRRFRNLRGQQTSETEDFWALKGVSFEVQPGDVVGIVGRNGAGKSTLLKILSRIVEPTVGKITMRGRVASLLEVGTGFHPELTGRENIFLNGSILGMKRQEIKARFDAIVDFAEIEQFLDTPVKRYSSGMYVRLAFAVAAHLDPEILIVDEVLAVGDAEFQKKCLGKIKEVSAGAGRTVLFVSHNMAAVRGLCTRGVLLRKGRVELVDSADAVVNAYARSTAEAVAATVEIKRPADHRIWMTRASLLVDGEASSDAPMGSKLSIVVDFQSSVPLKHPRLAFVLQSLGGEKLLNGSNRYQPSPQYADPVSAGRIVCELDAPPLLPGRYVISLSLGDTSFDAHDELEVLGFEVTEKDLWGLGQIPPADTPMWWPSTFHFHHALQESDSRTPISA